MDKGQVDALRDRFIRLSPTHSPIMSGWFDVLRGLYGGGGRYYHTLDHIADLLRRLDETRELSAYGYWRGHVLEVEHAIWFHDAIYDVKSKTNEADSAALAEAFFRTIGMAVRGLITEGPRSYRDNSVFACRVLDAIDATRHDGSNVQGMLAAEMMVDLDLAGFADTREQFDTNNVKIRKEYAIYTDDQYRWGRTQFLSGLLARPRIYHLLTDLEKPARANIERHVRELVGTP